MERRADASAFCDCGADVMVISAVVLRRYCAASSGPIPNTIARAVSAAGRRPTGSNAGRKGGARGATREPDRPAAIRAALCRERHQLAVLPDLTDQHLKVDAAAGAFGLGVAAQREAVSHYLNGGESRIIAEFTEVESGRRSDRPELERALAARVRRVPLVGRQG